MAVNLYLPRVSEIAKLTIANGGHASDYVLADEFGHFEVLTFVCPAAFTGTVSIQVLAGAELDETSAGNWRTHQTIPGTDDALAAGKAVSFPTSAGVAIRLLSSGAEGAERVVRLYARRAKVS